MAIADLKAFDTIRLNTNLPPMKRIPDFSTTEAMMNRNPREVSSRMNSGR